MEKLLLYISSHFLESLIILLLAILFFKQELQELLTNYFNIAKSKTVTQADKMADDMMFLRAHYNDETTVQLKEINETGKKNLILLEEIMKYGIKCRKNIE